MRLQRKDGLMTEEEADLEIDHRDAHWLNQICPIQTQKTMCTPCTPDCNSYYEAFKQNATPRNPNKHDNWRVVGGCCTCALVTGTIEHEGCECG
ncbi:hypothetical protein LCGC14_1934290 [marine sediment metagenome]|uniref:Uncharacterized protein n=1 Tax=marine sediment metagenome TaxID=412755 RepID=A0A0F9GAJ7_9ZZZZ